jgi:hypothetical protein
VNKFAASKVPCERTRQTIVKFFLQKHFHRYTKIDGKDIYFNVVAYQNSQFTEQQVSQNYSHMKLRAMPELIPPDGETKNRFCKSFQVSVGNDFLIKNWSFFPSHEKWFILNWKSSGRRIRYCCSE